MHTNFIQTILSPNKIALPPVSLINYPLGLFPFSRKLAPALQNIPPAYPSGKLLHTTQVFLAQKHTPVTILFYPKKITDRGGD